MTFLLGLLSYAFFPCLPEPVSDADLEDVRERRVRNIVASIATGNVSLQRGAFLTSTDIEKIRQKNEKRGFRK